MKISVIIPTINRAKTLRDISLPSLINQTFSNLEIIVWDASEDNSSKMVVEEFINNYPYIDIKYFYAERKGLASQRNDAIKKADGDIVLFIDDDVYLESHFLESLLKIYENDKEKKIGGAQGLILDPRKDETLKSKIVYFLTEIISFLFLLGGSSFRQKVLYSGKYVSYPVLPIDYSKKYLTTDTIDNDLQWLSGCCMSYRREIFEKFGYRFDEELEKFGGYAYMEDGDFSYRVYKNLKFQLVRVRSAICIHYHVIGGRGNLKNNFASRAYNQFIFLGKNIPFSILTILAFVWSQIGLIIVALFKSMVIRNISPLKGLCIAYITILKKIWKL